MATRKAPAAEMTLNIGMTLNISVSNKASGLEDEDISNIHPLTSAGEDTNLAQAYILYLTASVNSNPYLCKKKKKIVKVTQEFWQ